MDGGEIKRKECEHRLLGRQTHERGNFQNDCETMEESHIKRKKIGEGEVGERRKVERCLKEERERERKRGMERFLLTRLKQWKRQI